MPNNFKIWSQNWKIKGKSDRNTNALGQQYTISKQKQLYRKYI